MSTVTDTFKNGVKGEGNKWSKFTGMRQISNGDEMYSIGNIVHNTVIA